MEQKLTCLLMAGSLWILFLSEDRGILQEESICDLFGVHISHKDDVHTNLQGETKNYGYVSPHFEVISESLNRAPSTLGIPQEVSLKFLNGIKEKNDTFMIKNGNLIDADIAMRRYSIMLDSFEQLCNVIGVTKETRRQEFDRILRHVSPRRRSRMWRTWIRKRNELRKAARVSRRHLRLTLATELAILRQERHFPKLAACMNSLHNLDDSKLPVYVFFHPRISKTLGGKLGISIISLYDGVFTTASPITRFLYPDLPGVDRALTVHLTNYPSGRVLSHEFGHLNYLYHHWDEYQKYVQLMGCEYQPGGHGHNDPSGIAADLAERGIMAN